MLTENKIDKLKKELDELQSQTRVRNLTLQECLNAIEAAERAIAENVRPELRGLVRLQYNPHSVAKAYRYPAEGTVLFCTFTKAGTVSKIEVGRDYVRNEPQARLVTGVEKWIEEEFSLTRSNFGREKFDKLRLIVLSASGFNSHGTMHI